MSMVGEDKMSMDLEIKEKFEEHESKIEQHENRIRTLEIETAQSREALSNLQKGQDKLELAIQRLENITVTNGNAMFNSINTFAQLIETRDTNNTEKTVAKSRNIKDIIVQGIITGGALIGGFFAGGGGK